MFELTLLPGSRLGLKCLRLSPWSPVWSRCLVLPFKPVQAIPMRGGTSTTKTTTTSITTNNNDIQVMILDKSVFFHSLSTNCSKWNVRRSRDELTDAVFPVSSEVIRTGSTYK